MLAATILGSSMAFIDAQWILETYPLLLIALLPVGADRRATATGGGEIKRAA